MYADIHNATIVTNQYSVTEHFKESHTPTGHNLPGVFFFYDLSPIKVRTLWGDLKNTQLVLLLFNRK